MKHFYSSDRDTRLQRVHLLANTTERHKVHALCGKVFSDDVVIWVDDDVNCGLCKRTRQYKLQSKLQRRGIMT